MKITVTNNEKRPVERFGHVFKKDIALTIEVSAREYRAIKAVRALTVEVVKETTAAKVDKPKEIDKAKGDKAKGDKATVEKGAE